MPLYIQALVLLGDVVIISIGVIIIREVMQLGSVPPFIRTRLAIADEVAESFGQLPPGSVLYDPGCGDGRVLRAIAVKNPDARFVGIEMRRFPYLLAKWKIAKSGLKNIEFRKADIFTEDFGPATHIYTYLYSESMDQLLPKLEREVRPGTILISLDFPFSAKESQKEVALVNAHSKKLGKKLYIYRL